MIAARSWLFVPGDNARKIERALQGEADALILDWEDSVAPAAKNPARTVTVAVLASFRPPPSRCWIRINALASPDFETDLAALPGAGVAGVMLPKACGPADIERLGRGPAAVETKAGSRQAVSASSRSSPKPRHRCSRSASSAARCRASLRCSRVKKMAGDLGVARNRDECGRYREPFRLARSLMLMAAAAAECSAVDAVLVDFRDADVLALECKGARADGFTAKAAIHPDQVGAINHAFSATAQERAWAEQVIVALGNAGVGVVDGRMVDAPHLRLALRILSGRFSA